MVPATLRSTRVYQHCGNRRKLKRSHKISRNHMKGRMQGTIQGGDQEIRDTARYHLQSISSPYRALPFQGLQAIQAIQVSMRPRVLCVRCQRRRDCLAWFVQFPGVNQPTNPPIGEPVWESVNARSDLTKYMDTC